MVRAREHGARLLQPQFQDPFGEARTGIVQQLLNIARGHAQLAGHVGWVKRRIEETALDFRDNVLQPCAAQAARAGDLGCVAAGAQRQRNEIGQRWPVCASSAGSSATSGVAARMARYRPSSRTAARSATSGTAVTSSALATSSSSCGRDRIRANQASSASPRTSPGCELSNSVAVAVDSLASLPRCTETMSERPRLRNRQKWSLASAETSRGVRATRLTVPLKLPTPTPPNRVNSKRAENGLSSGRELSRLK